MLIYLCNVYGCFHTTVAELSSSDRDHMAIKSKIFIIWLFIEKVWQLLIYQKRKYFLLLSLKNIYTEES